MSERNNSGTAELQSPVETTSAETVEDGGGNEAEVVDDAGGVFMPTRQDGTLVPVERESELFRRPLTLNPTNQSMYDRYFEGKNDVRDLTDEEWAGYLSEVLVDPDPAQYAEMYGKSEVNAAFVRENIGGDQRREIAALSLESGGYSSAAANARGEMTEQERQNLEVMLSSGEIDIENLASQAESGTE